MEEIARTGKVVVKWNGKDVTADISRFVSSIAYTDREEYASDDITITLDNGEGLWSGAWYPTEGDTVQLYMGYSDQLINCGLFQVDEIVLSGKPDLIEIKAIAAGRTKELRTRNTQVFEAQTLQDIANFFCKKHGLTLVDNSDNMLVKVNLERKTQEEKTDLAFLAELATEFGFIFSVRGDKMIFTSYYLLDAAPSVRTIDKTHLNNYSLKEKTYDTYAGARLSARDSKSNKIVNTYENYTGGTVSADILITKGRASDKATAEIKVKAGLWGKNRFKQTGNLSDLPGDPRLVSGVNITLTGMGKLSGIYHVTISTHVKSGEGAYLTSLELRRTGSVLPPQEVPAKKTEATSADATGNDYIEEGENV